MAGTLQITDGTTTVNLLDTSGLYLAEKGWRPAVAQEDENGDYLPMIEVITLTWNKDNDDDRAEDLKKLKRLDRKAREWVRKRKKTDWVWMAASTHSETDTRYAIIHSIDIPDGLSERHWFAGKAEIKIVVEHKLWWHIPPNGTPATVVNGTTIRNYEDASYVNYVEIAAADVKGDAPALMLVEVPDIGRFYIMKRRDNGSTAFLQYLNYADHFISGSWSTQASSDVPGGEFGRLTGTTVEPYRTFTLPTPVSEFSGRYLVYAMVRTDTFPSPARLFWGYGYNSVSSYVDAGYVDWDGSYSTDWPLMYLGEMTVFPDGVPDYAGSSVFEIDLKIQKDSSCTVDLAGLVLLKVDESVMFVQTGGPDVIVDGRFESVYSVDKPTSKFIRTLPYRGRFITLDPAVKQRLYFMEEWPYPSGAHDITYWAKPDAVAPTTGIWDVTVKLVYRYTSLRGND